MTILEGIEHNLCKLAEISQKGFDLVLIRHLDYFWVVSAKTNTLGFYIKGGCLNSWEGLRSK